MVNFPTKPKADLPKPFQPLQLIDLMMPDGNGYQLHRSYSIEVLRIW
jgi:hypothetical protein